MIFTVTPNPVLDRTLTVRRIVPDEVLRATGTRLDWGGKGFNVSRALARLGVRSVAMGFVGGAAGETLRRGLESLGIEADLVPVAGESRTNIVIADEDGHHIKVNEEGPRVGEADVAALSERVRRRLQAGDRWVFCGSLPPGAPAGLYAQLIAQAQAAGARALLDSSGEPFRLGCQARPFGLKPNAREASELTGRAIGSPTDAAEAASELLGQGIELVALSLGADGLLLAAGRTAIWAEPPRLRAANPTGAGDALLAGLIHRITTAAASLDDPQALADLARWATACGTAAAAAPGVTFATAEEVAAVSQQVAVHPLPVPQRRQVTWPAANTAPRSRP